MYAMNNKCKKDQYWNWLVNKIRSIKGIYLNFTGRLLNPT